MKITLCVDKQDRGNPSEELKQYLIDIGCPLRSYKDVFDELKISTDDTNNLVGIITRRCYVDKYGVLKKLDVEEKQMLEIPEIQLLEGTNYVYILEYTNLNMKVEYLTNAEMNKYFATKMEMNSTIQQTYDSIMFKVSEKADSEEVSSMIKMLSDEIALKVAKGEIIASINMSPEKITIDADKLDLTANDILNIIAGNVLNLTSKKISISSSNFSVDINGNMVANNGEFKGKITGSEITGSKIKLTGDANDNSSFVIESEDGTKKVNFGFDGIIFETEKGRIDICLGDWINPSPAIVIYDNSGNASFITAQGII